MFLSNLIFILKSFFLYVSVYVCVIKSLYLTSEQDCYLKF